MPRIILVLVAIAVTSSVLAGNALGAVYDVQISDSAFSPSGLDVQTGDTVTWLNLGNNQHQISGEGFESPILNNGQSFSYTFYQNGSFTIRDTLQGFRSTITVGGVTISDPVPVTPVTQTDFGGYLGDNLNLTNVSKDSSITLNITEIREIAYQLSQEEFQELVDRIMLILENKTIPTRNELDVIKRISSLGCFFTEERILDMYERFKNLDDAGQQCFSTFLQMNRTRFDTLARSCSYIQDDFFTSQAVLQQYIDKGFAERGCSRELVGYDDVTGLPQYGETCYTTPIQIGLGCYERFVSLKEFETEKFDEGFSWGLLGFILLMAIIGIGIIAAINMQ